MGLFDEIDEVTLSGHPISNEKIFIATVFESRVFNRKLTLHWAFVPNICCAWVFNRK